MNQTITLGQRIAAARQQRKFPQPVLAEVCKVSRQAISQWENGAHTPRIDQLPVLAGALSVSIDYLLTGVGSGGAAASVEQATDLLAFLHYVRAEHGIDVPERHFEMLRALKSPAPSTLGASK